MRLKDVTEFCPAYTGAARNDAVAFVPMEALRYDSIAQQEIPFEEARGKYTFFADGDLLFAKVTPCFENGNIAIANNLKGGIGFGSSEIFVLRAKPGLNNRYLFYVVQASPFMDGGCATMCGVGGLKRMSPLFPRTFEWEIPSEESQRKIVAYLDEKSASIDGRVVVLEKKLSAYKRLKTSIINRAVTRGLDPKAKLKDSREVWIDKVPIGWTVGRFKDIATVRANLVAPDYYMDYPQIAPEHIEKGTGKLLSCGTVRESGIISGNHLFRKGQIIYSKIRPILNKLVVADFDGLCSADMYPIDVLGNLRFVFYQMLSPLFVNQVAAIVGMRVKMPKINQEELSAIGMVIPPLPEQRAIADYLDAECTKIDKMAELVTREIELYKKLKRSLINEVVTGKRPVFADKPLRRSKEVA